MEAPETLALTVSPPDAGARLDQCLAQSLGWSRARLQKLVKSGLVLVNGEVRPASYRVREGDPLAVRVPEPTPTHLAPEALPLTILLKIGYCLVVNKPPGLVVHPGAGHRAGTLLNALVHHCPDLKDIGEVSRPGLVHRLDKDTSGLIVVAKTSLAHAALVAQFQAHAITKRYQALVWGRLPEIEGEIDKEVGRHPQPQSEDERPRPAGQERPDLLAGHPGISRPPDSGGTYPPDGAHPSTQSAPGFGGPPGPGGPGLRRRGQPPGGAPAAYRPQTPGAAPASPCLAPGDNPSPHRRASHLGNAAPGGSAVVNLLEGLSLL